MNKKIKLLLILICCSLFISIFIISFNNKQQNSSKPKESSIKYSSGYKEIDEYNKKLDEIQFSSQIAKNLKNKGYQSAGSIGYSLYDRKEQNELIIQISSKEYKGKQTENEIKSIINEVLDINNLDPFIIKIEQIKKQ